MMDLAGIKTRHEEDGIGYNLEADVVILWLIGEAEKTQAAELRAERLRGWLEDIMQHASCDDCYAERKVLQAIEEDTTMRGK
jgi:ribosomal protein L17